MNATREYYQRRDVQLGLFGLSAFPGDEEEYQRLGEELRKLEAQIEKAAVSSTLFYIWRADPPYVHGVTEAHTITRNENLLLKEYQEAAFVDVWDTPILHAHYFHNFGDQGVRGEKTYFSYPANREPGKWLEHYQFDDFYRALAHVCTNYACLQGINLPDIPKEKQREVRLLMQQKWEIILRRAYL